jgi:phosphatidylethanolamine/phosphatidyl-N-methylethanolamine N-methyltransferase
MPSSSVDRERAFWEGKARVYDKSMKLFGSPIARMAALCGQAVAGAKDVLEVAAGTGIMTEAMAPRVGRLVATDYAEPMLEVLEERVARVGLTNVDIQKADLHDLAFPPGHFDAVVACNVLHLVPDLSAALAALVGVLRPGGALVVPTFCHDETRTSRVASRAFAWMGQPMHRRFTSDSLRRAVEEAGLRVDRAETAPGLIPIAFVAATRVVP